MKHAAATAATAAAAAAILAVCVVLVLVGLAKYGLDIIVTEFVFSAQVRSQTSCFSEHSKAEDANEAALVLCFTGQLLLRTKAEQLLFDHIVNDLKQGTTLAGLFLRFLSVYSLVGYRFAKILLGHCLEGYCEVSQSCFEVVIGRMVIPEVVDHRCEDPRVEQSMHRSRCVSKHSRDDAAIEGNPYCTIVVGIDPGPRLCFVTQRHVARLALCSCIQRLVVY